MLINFVIQPKWIRRRRLWHRIFLMLVAILSVSHVWLFLNSSSLTSSVGPLYRLIPGNRRGGDSLVLPPVSIESSPQVPVQISSSTLPATTARALLVKDHESGAVLYESNGYVNRPMASITKLMSALVLLDANLNWVTTTTVVVDDVEDTHMYAGDTYTVGDLWHSALIGSSNKAILSLVDSTGTTREQFVSQMNTKASQLGMVSTIFVEPTGLDEGNTATASDVAILLREAMNRPQIREAVVTPEYEIYSVERRKRHHMWNTDWLLLGWVTHGFHVLGGKTGYTLAAGYNVAVEVQDNMGRTLDIVVLGAASNEARFTDARDIANWVYQNFSWSTNR